MISCGFIRKILYKLTLNRLFFKVNFKKNLLKMAENALAEPFCFQRG